jgi:hypothetical protein
MLKSDCVWASAFLTPIAAAFVQKASKRCLLRKSGLDLCDHKTV